MLLDLIAADGIELRRMAGTSGGEFAGTCPRCGGHDRFRVWPNHPSGTARFHCIRGCDWHGDTIQYLRDQRSMSFHDAAAAADKALPEVVRSGDAQRKEPTAKEPTHDRTFLPAAEVGAWWASCIPVGDDHDVVAWLRLRGFNDTAIANIEDRSLARALPSSLSARWARSRLGSWDESGHRCILPVFDAQGVLHGVRARRLIPEEPKELPPTGYKAGGLVFADPLGRILLQTGMAPEWWIEACSGTPTIIIAEGGPDFLTWGAHFGDQEAAPSVIGIFSGAWTPEISARIPTGCRVLVRPHLGDNGHPDSGSVRYAQRIIATLSGRCDVHVWNGGAW